MLKIFFLKIYLAYVLLFLYHYGILQNTKPKYSNLIGREGNLTELGLRSKIQKRKIKLIEIHWKSPEYCSKLNSFPPT